MLHIAVNCPTLCVCFINCTLYFIANVGSMFYRNHMEFFFLLSRQIQKYNLNIIAVVFT